MATNPEKTVAWARSLLERQDWVLLDTETTGLSPQDEIVQIAVLGPDGRSLMDTYVSPTRSIPADATAIHGITDSDVQGAPMFPEVFDELKRIISGKTVVIYNAVFDLRLIQQTLNIHGVTSLGIDEDQVECAMLQYSAWCGERWPGGGYKWQKLRGGDHTALGDCRATLEVIRRMAG